MVAGLLCPLGRGLFGACEQASPLLPETSWISLAFCATCLI